MLLAIATALHVCGQERKSGLKLSNFYAHDPFILPYQANRTYCLYTAAGAHQTESGHAGVFVYKSKDLNSWEGPMVVFTVPDDIWANPAEGAWAPEAHEYRGKFYLSSSCSTTTTS